MNARYLWCQQQILEGEAEIIWGLFDDIWHFYHNKTIHKETNTNINNKTFIPKSKTEDQNNFVSFSKIDPENVSANIMMENSPCFRRLQKTESNSFRKSAKRDNQKSMDTSQSSTMTRRCNKAAEQSYSKLHYKSPIKDNYMVAASSMKQKIATPGNNQRNIKNSNASFYKGKLMTPQLIKEDSMYKSAYTSSKSLYQSSIFIL